MNRPGRIPVDGTSAPLQSPFASLDLADLPPGPVAEAVAQPSKRPGRVVLRREKARRGGKSVIVVADFDPVWSADEIADFARDARKHCGCGGTVAGREIELQGDDPVRIRRFFESRGFRVAGV